MTQTVVMSRHPGNPHPRTKRPINLSLNAELLDAAKALGLNVSQACERHLTELVHAEQMKRWQLEHADFVAAYNDSVRDADLPLDAWRTF